MLYNRKLVSQKLLRLVRERLENTQLPFVFDSGYLAAFCSEAAFRFFKQSGIQSDLIRPAQKICEGKIIVLANGSPFAVIVPYFLMRISKVWTIIRKKRIFASLIRIVKYVAFFLAVMLPGLFVSIANFAPELLPATTLYKGVQPKWPHRCRCFWKRFCEFPSGNCTGSRTAAPQNRLAILSVW